MSGLELHRLLRSTKLEGKRIGKVWRSGDLLVFEVTGGFLIARPGGFYPARYAPRGEPDGFCMYLRKHISGRVITGVRQHNLDRVVFLEVGDSELVFELFGRLNVALLRDGQVVASLRRMPRQYSPPESVNYLDRDEFMRAIEGKDKRGVARALGIGRLVEQIWGEPEEMWRRLRELAELPLSPEEVERRFREEDEARLVEQREASVNAERRRLEKSIAELRERLADYEERAARLRAAGSRILADLPRYDALLKKALQKGEKKIKVSLPDN